MIKYSSKNQDVIESAENFVQQLLGMDKQVDGIIEACKQHEDEFILNLYCAILYLYGQTEKTQLLAKQHIEKAEKHKTGSHETEQLLLGAVRFQVKGDYQKAINLYYQINLTEPDFLLATKLAEFCFFCIGQGYEARQYLHYIQPFYPQNKNNSDFLGMYSFALELSGNYDLALSRANDAIEICHNNPWAHHTISHVYTMTKQPEKGLDAFACFESLWLKKDVTIYSHNLWHLQLLQLDLLQIDSVQNSLETFFSFPPDLLAITVDKISLLWRLELAGYSQAEHWPVIAGSIIDNVQEQFTPFLNAHFFYALVRANQMEPVEAALQQYSHFAKQQQGIYHRSWCCVGQALMSGVVAFANEQWEHCCDVLEPHINEIGCVGGSDAQVDLFKQTYLVALIKAKRRRQAQAYFNQRTSQLPLTPLETAWASRIE